MRYQVTEGKIPRRDLLGWGLAGGGAWLSAPVLGFAPAAVPGKTAEGRPSLDPALLQKAIRRALQKGGDFAEVYVEHRISRSILLEEDKFKSAVFNVSRGAGVRVLSGDKTGYAYTDELADEKIMRAADVAAAIARESKPVTPVDIREGKRKSFITVRVPLQEVADEKRLDVMRRAHQAALDYDQRIAMASVSYYDEIRGRQIANSEGLLVSDELPLLFFILQALGKGNGTSHMGRERLSAHSGFELFDAGSAESAARACAREAIVMLEARDAPAGRMDVVMQNGWGGVLVHEAVGHPLEADNIARKIGAFTGKLGQKVAAPVFNMVDDGTLPNFRGTTDFDDEGTPMQRNVLIRDGVLLKYMSDILSARQLKAERTGNGRRESFRYLPIPRMTNTFIENGKDKPADILSSSSSVKSASSAPAGKATRTEARMPVGTSLPGMALSAASRSG